MSPDLPQFIEPSHLADVRAHLKGEMDTALMERFRESILDAAGPAGVSMTFSRNAQGVIRITGDYKVTVTLRCQRCLEAMEITLANPINLGLVATGMETDSQSEDYEPLVIEEKEIALMPLVEDELLLGLPMSPMHAMEECPAAKVIQDMAPEKASPFAVLKNLKS